MQEGGLNFLQVDRRAAQLEGGGETKGTCSLCVSGPGCHPSTAWQSMELNFFAWPSSKHRELQWYIGDVRSASDFKQKYPSGLYYSFRRFQKVKVMICWFFFAPPNRYFPPKSLKHCRCSSIAMYEASQVTLSASPTRAVLLQPPLAVPQGFVLFGWFGVHSPPCSLPRPLLRASGMLYKAQGAALAMEIFGSGGSRGGSCALVPAPLHVLVLRCLLGPGRSFPSWCPGDGCPGDRRWVGSLGIVSGGTTHQYGWMCQFGKGRERFAGNFWEKTRLPNACKPI